MTDEYGWWYFLGRKSTIDGRTMYQIDEFRDEPWGPEEVDKQKPGWVVLASCRHQPSSGGTPILPYPGCNISDPDVTLYADTLREFEVII
jgi:hypothetical protein